MKYFSTEVVAIHDALFWGEDNRDNLYWGTDKMFGKAQVEAATRGLMEKYGQADADLAPEIKIYEQAIAAQREILKRLAGEELTAAAFADILS